MTLRRKGTRRIVVREMSFRWTVAPNDEPGLAIVVEHEGARGRPMVTWVEHGTIIAPGLVKEVIHHALDAGWQPDQPGVEWVFRRK
ncbi:hypothetical protein [Corallococcus carmarthensis]|uniref:Uncharacterized protein n=1 Tax=Corallococcus carmarthensis TaxID=2316728 RepID=A0A3A8K284_9BACT|nr:hypothetical protein [Corallococcus carmarthensis]NOK22330.1 hypothetical protein [Corallococcus carmarthensis]RKH01606.1 hypothetical protein D7X32_19720 [Corallococcus carmarthensis]